MSISSWSEFRSQGQTGIFDLHVRGLWMRVHERKGEHCACALGTQSSFNVTSGRDLAWWRFRSKNLHPERVPFPLVCRSEAWRICEEVHRSWIGVTCEITRIWSTSRLHVEECSHRTPKHEGRRIDVMVSSMSLYIYIFIYIHLIFAFKLALYAICKNPYIISVYKSVQIDVSERLQLIFLIWNNRQR